MSAGLTASTACGRAEEGAAGRSGRLYPNAIAPSRARPGGAVSADECVGKRPATARGVFAIVARMPRRAARPRAARAGLARAGHEAAPPRRRAARLARVHGAEARGPARRDRRPGLPRDRADARAPSRASPQLHTIDRDWKRRAPRAPARRRGAARRALRARRYDLLVHLTEHPRGLALARLAARRATRSTRDAREAPLGCGSSASRTSTSCRGHRRATPSRRTSTRCGASAS